MWPWFKAWTGNISYKNILKICECQIYTSFIVHNYAFSHTNEPSYFWIDFLKGCQEQLEKHNLSLLQSF